jgi:hypothetical protein
MYLTKTQCHSSAQNKIQNHHKTCQSIYPVHPDGSSMMFLPIKGTTIRKLRWKKFLEEKAVGLSHISQGKYNSDKYDKHWWNNWCFKGKTFLPNLILSFTDKMDKHKLCYHLLILVILDGHFLCSSPKQVNFLVALMLFWKTNMGPRYLVLLLTVVIPWYGCQRQLQGINSFKMMIVLLPFCNSLWNEGTILSNSSQ